MSLTPLLKGKSTSESRLKYGALSNRNSESSLDVPQNRNLPNTEDDIRERDKRKGRSATFSPPTRYINPNCQRVRDESDAHSSQRVRRTGVRNTSPVLRAEASHPTGYGEQVDNRVQLASSDASEDGEEAISTSEDDKIDSLDNSPYPQVRTSVPATDDTSLSINTPRMWILSLLCAFLGSAANLFFSLRYPSVAITSIIALVVVHPIGRMWDRLLKHQEDPVETFEDGVLTLRAKPPVDIPSFSSAKRLRLWLAQGDWNEKEHACVYVSSNVSFGFAFATDVIVEQSKFYHQSPSIIYQLLLTISTQILGYAFAGLTRNFLVRPPSMIWPGALMSTAMFTTMHNSANAPANGWIISRWRLFLLVWSGAFAWYFLPGLLMPALSYFNFITWFAPKNVIIANLVSLLVNDMLELG